MRSRFLRTALCLALVLLGASPPAWVHHSGAMFDRSRTIQISGVVKEFLWTNPHSSFKVEVPDAEGGEAAALVHRDECHVEPGSRGLEEEHDQARRQGHRHHQPAAGWQARRLVRRHHAAETAQNSARPRHQQGLRPMSAKAQLLAVVLGVRPRSVSPRSRR